MTARLMFATAVVMSLSGAALAADPAPQQPRDPNVAAPRELVLASADVKAPAAGNSAQAQAQAPARRRTARVTTCRCGDPQPQDGSADGAESVDSQ